MLFDLNINYNFNDIIAYMQSFGVYNVVLPFILVFSIVFAVLEKTQILGSGKKNINAVVSMVFGLLLVAQPIIVDTINLFLPKVALIIVILLMFLLLVSMLTANSPIHFEGFALGVGIIIIIVSLFIALSPSFDISQDVRDAILRIVIPLGVLFGVYKLVTGSDDDKGTNYVKELGDSVKFKSKP